VQEEEENAGRQQDPDEQVHEHVVHGIADEDALVAHDGQGGAGREFRPHLLDRGKHAGCRPYRVRVGPLLDRKADCRFAVVACDLADVFESFAHGGQVCQPRHAPLAKRQAQLLDLANRPVLAHDAHRDVGRTFGYAPGRHRNVLCPDQVYDLGQRDAVGAHPLDVDQHLDLALAAAGDGDVGHAVNARQPVAQLEVGKLVQRVHALRAGQRQVHDRQVAEIELLDRRRLDLHRHQSPHAFDPVSHVYRRLVLVHAEIELDDDEREVLLREGAELVYVRQACHRLLDAVGDLRLYLLGAGAGIDRRHGDRPGTRPRETGPRAGP
jgi:hypothetical protein